MRQLRNLFVALISLFIIAACQNDPLPTLVPGVEATISVPTLVPADGTRQPVDEPPTVASATPIPATATPSEPLAAAVNGQPILLALFEKELARYEQAQLQFGSSNADQVDGYRGIVLDALIETELISQAAAANGITLTPEMVTARMAELQELSGGEENFMAWLQTNQMTVEEFIVALAAEMLTEKTVDFVTSDVPRAVEQVHARYIQVDDQALAQSLLEQLRSGVDFVALAQQYSLDRITGENGGDLSFFARGSLLVPEIEEAAFNLQPGEFSEVVAGNRADGSGTTFYIIQLIERDPQRELSADLLFKQLQQRFEQWLAQQWDQAEIIRFIEI